MRVNNIVKIDNMQFGFIAGRGETDADFTVEATREILSKEERPVESVDEPFLIWRKHLIGFLGRWFDGC